MTLRVIGAGLGRTGTTSLKAALEALLRAPCYHMDEVFAHDAHVPIWRSALRGERADLKGVMRGYAASVDWPAGACWRQLLALYPDALVLLSIRESAEAWWRSADRTILRKMREPVTERDPIAISSGMIREMMVLRFTPDWNDKNAALTAYHKHNDEVRQLVPRKQLLEWKPGDGWGPICHALRLEVPQVPFPHKNSAEEFRGFYGWE